MTRAYFIPVAILSATLITPASAYENDAPHYQLKELDTWFSVCDSWSDGCADVEPGTYQLQTWDEDWNRTNSDFDEVTVTADPAPTEPETLSEPEISSQAGLTALRQPLRVQEICYFRDSIIRDALTGDHGGIGRTGLPSCRIDCPTGILINAAGAAFITHSTSGDPIRFNVPIIHNLGNSWGTVGFEPIGLDIEQLEDMRLEVSVIGICL